jgi:hypothetical protein
MYSSYSCMTLALEGVSGQCHALAAVLVRLYAYCMIFSSSLYIQTRSEAHPASYPMGTRGPFLRIKHSWGMTLTTHPLLVPRSIISRSYTSSSPWCLHGGNGQLYFYDYDLFYILRSSD